MSKKLCTCLGTCRKKSGSILGEDWICCLELPDTEKPMTTPEDQKAAQCPFCGSDAMLIEQVEENECNLIGGGMSIPVYSRRTYYQPKCSSCECKLDNGWQSKDNAIKEWNTRPREQELEEELAAANEYNDTDKPLSEVMAAISDAVMDFHPDVESASAGTLIERVETAAELAKRASERERGLEGVLQKSKALFELIQAIDKSAEKELTKAGLCVDPSLSMSNDIALVLSAINAALEEKR